jgi:DNA-binding XRE family transcriptional regulator
MNKEIKTKILENFKNQAELAGWLSVSKQLVSFWMTGRQNMGVKHAAKLAKKIGCDLLDIRDDLK